MAQTLIAYAPVGLTSVTAEVWNPATDAIVGSPVTMTPANTPGTYTGSVSPNIPAGVYRGVLKSGTSVIGVYSGVRSTDTNNEQIELIDRKMYPPSITRNKVSESDTSLQETFA